MDTQRGFRRGLSFLASRLAAAVAASLALAVLTTVYLAATSIHPPGSDKFWIDVRFAAQGTLTLSLPVAVVIAPALALALRRTAPWVKTVLYALVGAAVAYAILPGFEPLPFFVFGAVGGVLFGGIERFLPT